MRITRLYLRNYRVYEHELDLEMPAGLVGIFGPNGAGKSYLIEAIPWTLFGVSRTDKGDVRTSGVNADCVTEVEFEHQGNLYLVRRQLVGQNATVKAEVHANRAQVAEGVRDSAAYVQSILGLDAHAFKASVFAEQKQLASFSRETPAKRRELVLRLLGISPLDDARDGARRDAKAKALAHDQARRMLPDLTEREGAVKAATVELDTAEPRIAELALAAAAARSARVEAETAFERIETIRSRHEQLVTEGRGVATERDLADAEMARLVAELAVLITLAPILETAQTTAASLGDLQTRLRAVLAVAEAQRVLDATPSARPAAEPDETGAAALATEAGELANTLAHLDGQLGAAKADLLRAQELVKRSSELTRDGDCPVCGQALGEAAAQVIAHRQQEFDAAQARAKALTAEHAKARTAAADAKGRAAGAAKAVTAAREAHARAQAVSARRAVVQEVLASAETLVDPPASSVELPTLRARVATADTARQTVAELTGRLSRQPEAEAALAAQHGRRADAEARRAVLLAAVKALNFDPTGADKARRTREEARTTAERAQSDAHQAEITATRARAALEDAERRLVDAQTAHGQLETLADDARHLSRLAELLSQFRNSVVASVGPTLAVHAASLFAELTDREYDQLEVDAETFDLQITDAGHTYGMDRFSGSETDLANLALRVAISENIRLQAGGAVGLLVLDEVFGPLDEDRRDRMLSALERLKSRFQQVLVVTHATDVKEQLPNAIEVVKLPGRRATARVVV